MQNIIILQHMIFKYDFYLRLYLISLFASQKNKRKKVRQYWPQVLGVNSVIPQICTQSRGSPVLTLTKFLAANIHLSLDEVVWLKI